MPTKIRHETAWAFAGFTSPNTTAVPDQFFDELMPRLSEAELRCLLYIIRRTFGFKKEADSISFRQLVAGITTRDGRVLDRGTGLSKSAVARGLNGLEQKGIIITTRNRSVAKGNEPTTYALRFQADTLSSKETRGCPPEGQALVLQKDTQYTVLQQTDTSSKIEREDSGNKERTVPVAQRLPETPSGAPGFTRIGVMVPQRFIPPSPSSEDREVIQHYVADIANAFGDRASLRASTTRALGLWQRSGIIRAAFINRLFEARALTEDAVRSGREPVRNRMAFFFTVLGDVLGLQGDKRPPLAISSANGVRSPAVLNAGGKP